jgi:hypothetical protein
MLGAEAEPATKPVTHQTMQLMKHSNRVNMAAILLRDHWRRQGVPVVVLHFNEAIPN